MQATPPQGSAQLDDYGRLVRRQWWVALLCLLVGAGLGVAYTFVAATQYVSTTSVLVTSTGVSEQPAPTARTSGINLDTEAQLVTSTEIVGAAAKAINHPGDPAELVGRVSVTVPPNTEILEIGYTGDTAQAAQAGARAFATAYLDNRRGAADATLQATRQSLQARIDDLTKQLQTVSSTIAGLPADSAGRAFSEAQASSLNNQISSLGTQLNQVGATTVTPGRVITDASLPSRPSSPNLDLDVLAGALVGLLVGLWAAVLRQRSDRVLRSAGDVERRTGLPVLAELPGTGTGQVDLLVPGSNGSRSYARLRNVVLSSLSGDHRVILVAGVTRPAGPVAANLAASLARSGEEVVLVCGDVHGTTAADLLDGRTESGLAEILAGRVQLDDARRRVAGAPNLWVLGPGRDPDQAAALLQTGSPRQLLQELLTTAQWVVVEAPPTTSGADAQTLAGLADRAILVVATEETREDDVADARAQLELVRTVTLGAVVLPTDRRAERRARRDADHRSAAAPVPEEIVPVGSGRGSTAAAGTPADEPTELPDAPDAEPATARGARG